MNEQLADILTQLQAAQIEYQACDLEDVSNAEGVKEQVYFELLEFLSPTNGPEKRPDLAGLMLAQAEENKRLRDALSTVDIGLDALFMRGIDDADTKTMRRVLLSALTPAQEAQR